MIWLTTCRKICGKSVRSKAAFSSWILNSIIAAQNLYSSGYFTLGFHHLFKTVTTILCFLQLQTNISCIQMSVAKIPKKPIIMKVDICIKHSVRQRGNSWIIYAIPWIKATLWLQQVKLSKLSKEAKTGNLHSWTQLVSMRVLHSLQQWTCTPLRGKRRRKKRGWEKTDIDITSCEVHLKPRWKKEIGSGCEMDELKGLSA